MKKLLSMLLVLTLIVVSCATPQETNSPEASGDAPVKESTETTGPAESGEQPATSGEKTVIKFAVQADSTEALNELVKAFNEKSEKYQVEPIIMTNDSGQMYDQLLNSLSSKSGEYDVISMDVVWAGTFAASGFLMPIDEVMMENNWTVNDFNKGSMDSGKYMGKNYVLPYFPDLGFLYIRKDIVSAEDLAKLKSGEYTWDDLLEMSKKYKGQGGTKDGIAFQAKQYEGLTVNANEFTGNWQDVKAGIEVMKKFIDEKVVPEDILNYDEGATATSFTNGETVFARNWPYMNGMIQAGDLTVKPEQVDYAPLPSGGSVGGWILGINANSKNIEGAKEFLAFVAGPEGQKINATVGSYLPGFNQLLEDEEVLKSNALLTNEGFQKALEKTIARPVVADYAKVSDAIQISVQKFLSGSGTIDDVMKTIEDALTVE